MQAASFLQGGRFYIAFDALFIRLDDFGTSGSVSDAVEFSGDLVTFYPSAAPGSIDCAPPPLLRHMEYRDAPIVRMFSRY